MICEEIRYVGAGLSKMKNEENSGSLIKTATHESHESHFVAVISKLKPEKNQLKCKKFQNTQKFFMKYVFFYYSTELNTRLKYFYKFHLVNFIRFSFQTRFAIFNRYRFMYIIIKIYYQFTPFEKQKAM